MNRNSSPARALGIATLAAVCGAMFPAAASATLVASKSGSVLLISNNQDASYGVRARVLSSSISVDALGKLAQAGSGCTRTSATKLKCSKRGVSRVVITGSNRGDRLFFEGSLPVRISGRGGNDTLIGGTNQDRLDAGPGVDRIFAQDGSRDTVICGAGPDGEAKIDTLDRPSGCERIEKAFVAAKTDENVSIDRRGARVELQCHEERASCAGTITVRLRGRSAPLGRRNYSGLPGGRTRLFIVPMSEAAKDAAANAGPIAQGSVRVTTGRGRGFTSVQSIPVTLLVTL